MLARQHPSHLLAATYITPGDIPLYRGTLQLARPAAGRHRCRHPHYHPGPGLRHTRRRRCPTPYIAGMNVRHLRRRGRSNLHARHGRGAHDCRFLRQPKLPCKPGRPAVPPASPDGQDCRAALTGHLYAAERAPCPPHRAAEWQPVTPKMFPFCSSPLASGLTAAPVKRVIRPAQSPPRGYPRSARRGFASAPIPDPRSAPG